MMMAMGCTACHGTNGDGPRTRMLVSSNITERSRTDPSGMVEPDGCCGPTDTDDQFAQAITQGIDAEGQLLAWPMPRWQMADQELNDLLTYLKTLQ